MCRGRGLTCLTLAPALAQAPGRGKRNTLNSTPNLNRCRPCSHWAGCFSPAGPGPGVPPEPSDQPQLPRGRPGEAGDRPFLAGLPPRPLLSGTAPPPASRLVLPSLASFVSLQPHSPSGDPAVESTDQRHGQMRPRGPDCPPPGESHLGKAPPPARQPRLAQLQMPPQPAEALPREGLQPLPLRPPPLSFHKATTWPRRPALLTTPTIRSFGTGRPASTGHLWTPTVSPARARVSPSNGGVSGTQPERESTGRGNTREDVAATPPACPRPLASTATRSPPGQ
ncbi:basic salivary proline-rich protein 2-like [Eubalaena glacialis]|uniref:basic salivary proline-rich protein 2-like n=1 Tax=Eubalaena glacialis TaxID=27606 RepID=UPI002A5AD33C|nr:basic salivary proline-rich protein 2-like [Eubalaena glacialis]